MRIIEFDNRFLSIFLSPVGSWIRFKNSGTVFHIKNTPPLFSERNGYVKSYQLVGEWRLLLNHKKRVIEK